QTSTVL
ncbi:metallo-beta-lactamase superfamily protein, partial [Vibrio parahaemolyticus V-223/04]